MCCSLLWFVAVCCSVLEHQLDVAVAFSEEVRCGVLQSVVVRVSVLQCVAVCCSVLEHQLDVVAALSEVV